LQFIIQNLYYITKSEVKCSFQFAYTSIYEGAKVEQNKVPCLLNFGTVGIFKFHYSLSFHAGRSPLCLLGKALAGPQYNFGHGGQAENIFV
jgi:hypothetical protein